MCSAPIRSHFFLATLFCASLSWHCGADDLNAPPVAVETPCPSVDSYLEDVYALMDEGKLDNLQSLVRDGLTESERQDLVLAVINIIDQFEPGAFGVLNDVTSAVPLSEDVQSLLSDALFWMSTADTTEAFAATRTLFATCDGPPSLTLLRDLLLDDTLMEALGSVFDTIGSSLTDRIAGIEWNGAEGRIAIRALVQNLLASATQPDFDTSTIVDLLAFIVDVETPPWSGLVAALEALFDHPERRAQLQGLLLCLRDVDPDLALVDLIVDLLADDSLNLGSQLSAVLNASDPTAEDLADDINVLKGPLETVLDLLIADTFTRRSLTTALSVGLAPQWAPGALGDLSNLFGADVLDSIVELIAAIADQECLP